MPLPSPPVSAATESEDPQKKGQVEDDRLGDVVSDRRYVDATREVLRRHSGLWFYDESYVISRRRE
jgi:hypothetical protein